MTSEINKLKHFHIEDYSGINFTEELENKAYEEMRHN